MTDFFSDSHVHVMLNHIPVLVLGASLFVLLYGIIRRENHSLGLGFFLCFVCALFMIAVDETGEGAVHAFKKGALAPLIDKAGLDLIEEHEERAETAVPVVYAAGALGLLGLLALWRKQSLARAAGILTFVVGLAGFGLGLWTAEVGGQIRHVEFR